MKILVCLCALMLLVGCANTIQINTIKSWEGHFLTTNEFYNATKNIQLNSDETIWVLSDKTLNGVLKNLGK